MEYPYETDPVIPGESLDPPRRRPWDPLVDGHATPWESPRDPTGNPRAPTDQKNRKISKSLPHQKLSIAATDRLVATPLPNDSLDRVMLYRARTEAFLNGDRDEPGETQCSKLGRMPHRERSLPIGSLGQAPVYAWLFVEARKKVNTFCRGGSGVTQQTRLLCGTADMSAV